MFSIKGQPDSAVEDDKTKKPAEGGIFGDIMAVGALGGALVVGVAGIAFPKTACRVIDKAEARVQGLLDSGDPEPLAAMQNAITLQDVLLDTSNNQFVLIHNNGREERLSFEDVEVNTNTAPEGHPNYGRCVLASHQETRFSPTETYLLLPPSFNKRDTEGNPLPPPPNLAAMQSE